MQVEDGTGAEAVGGNEYFDGDMTSPQLNAEFRVDDP